MHVKIYKFLKIESFIQSKNVKGNGFINKMVILSMTLINHFIVDEEQEVEVSKPVFKSQNKTKPATVLAHEYHVRKMEIMEKEHDLRIRILEEELSTKKLEREHRIMEHEQALRNLCDMHNVALSHDNVFD